MDRCYSINRTWTQIFEAKTGLKPPKTWWNSQFKNFRNWDKKVFSLLLQQQTEILLSETETLLITNAERSESGCNSRMFRLFFPYQKWRVPLIIRNYQSHRQIYIFLALFSLFWFSFLPGIVKTFKIFLKTGFLSFFKFFVKLIQFKSFIKTIIKSESHMMKSSLLLYMEA